MNWLRGKLSLNNKPHPEKAVFMRIWKKQQRSTKNDQLLVQNVSRKIRAGVSSRQVDPVRIAGDIVRFVTSSTGESQRDVNRKLLLELTDILAWCQPDDRDVVRLVLSTLYSMRRTVDREVFLFSHGKFTKLDDDTRRKTTYMLQAVAGWKLPTNNAGKANVDTYFLDLPMTTTKDPIGGIQSPLIHHAMYYLHDEQLVLDILRCGASPSCFYLWPVCMQIDMCLVWQRNGMTDDSQFTTHMAILRYFCRARHYIYTRITVDGADVHIGELLQGVGGVGVEDILLLTADVQRLLPEERYKHASRLKHQARLAIRRVLFHNDRLPRGIQHLGLPQTMRDYIDLLSD